MFVLYDCINFSLLLKILKYKLYKDTYINLNKNQSNVTFSTKLVYTMQLLFYIVSL